LRFFSDLSPTLPNKKPETIFNQIPGKTKAKNQLFPFFDFFAIPPYIIKLLPLN